MDTKMSRALSQWLFVGGFASIFASICVWYWARGADPAHGERFGLFIGLWAPTFFILSERFARLAVGGREGMHVDPEVRRAAGSPMGLPL